MGKLDPRVKGNWKGLIINRWFWVLAIGFIGYMVVRFGPW